MKASKRDKTLKVVEPRTASFTRGYKKLKADGKLPPNAELAALIGLKGPNTVTEIIGRRQNIDPESWERFKDIYGLTENDVGTGIVVDRADSEKEDLGILNERLLRIESHLEVYESAIAGLQSTDTNDFMKRVSELRKAVSEAVNRRLVELRSTSS